MNNLGRFDNFELNIFGSSHAQEIGVVIKNLPKGFEIDIEEIQKQLDRRKSGKNVWSTPRIEADKLEVTSGIKNDKTDGTDFVAVIKNTNQNSKDYTALQNTPRPSHADYAAKMKFGLDYDMKGGGKFSGRMTAPLVIAGSIAQQILASYGVYISAYISSIASINAPSYKDTNITKQQLQEIRYSTFPVLSQSAKEIMEKAILLAKNNQDSVGGNIDCIVFDMPLGIGDALFDGLESKISQSIFAIPAVKGIEFGSGFDLSNMFGSQSNDEFCVENGKIVTLTNNNGGINGGISNGMPITMRVAIKPTPSIGKLQNTVDILAMQNTTIKIAGRHDACIVPRAVVAVESSVALAILDAILTEKKG